MLDQNNAEIAETAARETRRRSERRDTREDVRQAFESAWSKFDAVPDAKLSEDERRDRRAIRGGKERTLDQGKDKFPNTFSNSLTAETFTTQEAIPVEGLIDWLRKEVQSGSLAPGEAAKYKKEISILLRHSRKYYRSAARSAPTQRHGRLEQEAYYLSQEPARAQMSLQENYYQAEQLLSRRRELIMPRAVVAEAVTPSPDQAPATQDNLPSVDTYSNTTAAAYVAANTINSGAIPIDPEDPGPQPSLSVIHHGHPATIPPPAVLASSTETPPVHTPIIVRPEDVATTDVGPDGPAPTPVSLERVRRDFVIARRDVDLRKRATELAETQLRDEIRRGAWYDIRHWPRKIALRVAEEHYRQRLIERGYRAMLENNNAYLDMDVFHGVIRDANARRAEERAAGQAKITQIRTGERFEGQQVEEAQGALRTALMNNVIRRVVDGTITTEAQAQDALRTLVQDFQRDNPGDLQFQAVFGRDATQYGRLAEYFATDLLETGQMVKEDLAAHRYALEQLDEVISIKLANVSWAAETQANFNAVDRFVAWTQRTRLIPGQDRLMVSHVVNPAVAGALASAVTFLGFKAAGTAASTAGRFLPPGIGTLLGGSLAAVRRNYDLKVDRAAHQIERTYNMQIPTGARRREVLERFSYNTASVNELINGGGREVLGGGPRRSVAELIAADLSNQPNRDAVIRRITEIRTRLDFSARNRVDLVTFESREQVEQGRLQLVQAIIQSRRALEAAGMTQAQIAARANEFNGGTAGNIGWEQVFTQNREEQDRSFRNYRVKQAIGAGLFGGAVGLAGGLLVQEGIALGARGVGINVATTPLEQAANFVTGHRTNAPSAEVLQEAFKAPHGQALETFISDQHKLTVVPAGHAVPGRLPDVFITDSNNAVLPNMPKLHLEANGHIIADGALPPGVQQELEAAHYDIKLGPETVDALHPTHVDLSLGSSNVEIPVGTHWERDGNFWDLVSDHKNPDGSWKVLLDNASLAPDGRVSFIGVGQPGLVDIQESSVVIPGGPNKVDVLGPNGLLTPHVTSVEHVEGYGYDLPGSQLNELRLETFKDGDAIILSMKNMYKDLSIDKDLIPPEYNVEKLYQAGKTYFAFHFADGNPRINKEWVMVFADTNGELRLDPNDTKNMVTFADGTKMPVSEFAKAVYDEQKLAALHPADGNVATELNAKTNPDYFNVWKLGGTKGDQFGLISAGTYVVNDPATGEDTWKSFATIRGAGATTGIETPGGPTTIFETKILPIERSAEIIPPSEIPLIPIPFAPRHPLERLAPPIDRSTPYGYEYAYSYDRIPQATQEYYRSRFSDRLRGNRQANLRPDEEIPDYFQRQGNGYVQQLNTYLSQPGMQEPMDEQCDAAVCIPVYTLGEGKVIQNALEQYLLQIDKTRNKQAIDPRKFELMLFLNHPRQLREEMETKLGKPLSDGAEARVRSGRPEAYDTAEVIRQFQQAHPELRIRVMATEFDRRQEWGKIIKPLYDLALLRASRRANPYRKDPLIITNDIDVVDMSPTYLRDILQKMDLNEIASSRNPSIKKLDGLVGKVDMPNHGYEKVPGFLFAERLYQFLDSQVRKRPDRRVLTQGRSTIIRGSTYAAMGGVNPNTDAGADVELGRIIATGRGDNNTVDYLNSSWLHTDPRRELDMWLKGIPLAYAWNEWAAMNVYGNDWKQRFSRPPQDPTRIDKETVQREINTELQRWNLAPDSREIKRALAFLGLTQADYHIVNNQIVVDRLDGVIGNLQDYITERRWETTEQRKSDALAASPAAHVKDNFYAEYLDYEEYDRIYSDIFESQEYPWTPPPGNPAPNIIDLGSHIGMSVMYWKNLARGAKITAVEANPETAGVLQRNIARNKMADVKLVQAAASSRTGQVDLYMPKAGVDFHWGDFVGGRPVDPSKYDRVPVPTVKLSTLINGPVDLLKVDIEGSELEVLREAESKLSQVKEIMLEFHNDPSNPTNSLSETLALLRGQGYQLEVRQWNKPIDPSTLNTTETFFLTVLAKRP